MLHDDTRAPVEATPEHNTGGLYIIWLSDTHYYGGRTKNFKRRWASHLRELRSGRHNNRRMQRVYDQYGRFEPRVFSVLNPDECPDAEQQWLDDNFRKPGCVNLVSSSRGGMAGCKVTPATIAKRVATFRSRPDMIEKARASIARNGIKFTPEIIRRGVMASATKNRGRKQPPEQIARRVAAITGRKNTLDTIEKMRNSGRRRAAAMPTVHGADTRALISTQQRGREWVNNGTQNRRVWPAEVDALVSDGWVRGKLGRTVAGYVLMLDTGGVRRRVPATAVLDRESEGWARVPSTKKKYVPVSDPKSNHQGTVWVRRRTDVDWECRRVPTDAVAALLLDGWEVGMRPASEDRKNKVRASWSSRRAAL